MARLIYPTLQAPVLTDAQLPEAVLESKFHQPLSEPINPLLGRKAAIALIASGFAAISPWALTQGETPSLDKFLRPLSEPVRLPKRLNPGLQPSSFLTRSGPFLESVTIDRWLRPLNEPPAFLRARAVAFQFYTPPRSFDLRVEFVGPDKWYTQLTEPVRLPKRLAPGLQPAYNFTFSAPFPEALQLKWFAPLSSPVMLPRPLPVTLQLHYVIHDWPDLRPDWMVALSEPRRRGYRIATRLGVSRENTRSEFSKKT